MLKSRLVLLIPFSFFLGIVAFSYMSAVSKRFNKQYFSGEATPSMIKDAKTLIFFYSVLLFAYPKYRRQVVQNWHEIIAITAFAMGDYPCFLKYIRKGKTETPFQSAWLALYHLTVSHDIELPEPYLQKLDPIFPAESLAKGVYFFEKGEREQGYLLIKKAIPKLQSAASKKLAKEYLQKYEPQEKQA